MLRNGRAVVFQVRRKVVNSRCLLRIICSKAITRNTLRKAVSAARFLLFPLVLFSKFWSWLWRPIVHHGVFAAGWYDDFGVDPNGPAPGHRAAFLRFAHELLWHASHPFCLIDRLYYWLYFQGLKLGEGGK